MMLELLRCVKDGSKELHQPFTFAQLVLMASLYNYDIFVKSKKLM